MSKQLILTIGLAVGAAASSAALAAEGSFSNVTESSGVADLVAKQYAVMDKVLAERRYNPDKWWLSGMTLADLDNNGTLDLHLAAHGMEAIAAANDGKGHFTQIECPIEAKYGKGKTQAVAVPGGEIRGVFDLDEDGKLDLLMSYHDGGGVVAMNDCQPASGGTGGAAGAPPTWNFKPYQPGFDSYSRGIAFCDLNRDGLVDYLRGPDSKIDIQTTISLGQGQAKWVKSPTTITTLKEAGLLPIDLNGDGFLDLLVNQNGYSPTACKVLLNDGQMNFKDSTEEAGLNPAAALKGAGDINQDGISDVIGVENNAVVIYLGDGKGHFTKGPAVTGAERAPNKMPQTAWGAAVVVDFDNDGIPDVIVNSKTTMYVLRGLGGAPGGKLEYVSDTWNLPTTMRGNLQESGATFGDIDNDGMLDLVSSGPGPAPGGNQPGVAVYHNDLPRKHWVNVQLVGAKGNRAATSAKIRLFEPSAPDDARKLPKLLSYEQVAVWGRESFHSYYARPHTERHFGLGDRQKVDISVEFYPSGKTVGLLDVPADTTIVIEEK